ncbi:Non-catalytic module family DOC2, partial [Piromyces sp. E2]
CWSEEQGYSCCKDKNTKVQFTDESGDWGVEDNKWCGITDLQRCPSFGDYKCCKKCEIIYTDTEDWGVEDNNWCSIPYSCKAENDKKN